MYVRMHACMYVCIDECRQCNYMKRHSTFFLIFKSIKIFCILYINWWSVPKFWSVEVKVFSIKGNLVSSRNIQIQFISVVSNSIPIPLFKNLFRETGI